MTSLIAGRQFGTHQGPTRSSTPRIVVVGMGNKWRRDDGVGPAVARLVAEHVGAEATAGCRVFAQLDDPLDLLNHFDGADLAVVVDATRRGLSPGTVSIIDLEEPGDALASSNAAVRPTARDGSHGQGHGPSSTHGLGLAGVLRLARALERSPRRTLIVGVEGEEYGAGSELSPTVAAATGRAAATVLDLIKDAFACA